MGDKTDKSYEIMYGVMDRLDEILCSYQGFGHQSVYIDIDSLALFAKLLVYGLIKAQPYQYAYDMEIYNDEEADAIYRELAPQTRWKTGRHTQIEPIRMNALKQFAAMGTPIYDGYIYYPDTESVLVCGEILPYEIFQLFADRHELQKLYVFPYPFQAGEEKSAYYSFESMEKAREEMRKYVKRKQEEVYRIIQEKSAEAGVIPKVFFPVENE